MNLREKILNARDIQSERVKVPEWDVELEVRSMIGTQRARLLEAAIEKKNGNGDGKIDGSKMQAMVIIETVYDPETGNRVFEEADRDAIMGKNAHALDVVGKVALRLSGMSGDEEKNGSAASETSGIASPKAPQEP
jgi:hypothetical protein